MMSKPTAEHAWLAQLVGTWDVTTTCTGPDGVSFTGTAVERNRMLGDLWLVSEWEGDMGGTQVRSAVTLGFDARKSRFVGAWAGSPMDMLWVYDGWLDEARKVLTLESTGPNFAAPGKDTTYQDVIELVEPGEKRFRSRALGENGKWVEFQTATHRRREG